MKDMDGTTKQERDMINTFSPLERRIIPILTRLRLQTRMRIVVLCSLLIVLAGLGFLGMQAVRESNKGIQQGYLAATELAVYHLDQSLRHKLDHLQFVARTYGYDTTREPGSTDPKGEFGAQGIEFTPEEAQDVLSRFPHFPLFHARILFYSSQGRVLAAQPPLEPSQIPRVEDPPEVALSLEKGRPLVSNATTISTGDLGIRFVVPFFSNGISMGAIVAESPLPLPGLETIPIVLGTTGHLQIIDANGLVIGSTAEDELLKFNEHPEFYRTLLQSRQKAVGSTPYVEEDGEVEGNHIMAFAPLNLSPWGVGLGQDEVEALAPVMELRNRLILAGVVIVMGALAIGWWGTELVAKPVRVLEGAAQRIIWGDLNTPIALPHQDELGALAHSLDMARQKLRDSRESLELWNQELERRVRERTLELTERNMELTTLHAISTAISQSVGVENTVKPVLDVMLQSLDLDAAWVIARHGDGKFLEVEAKSGLADTYGESPMDWESCVECVSLFLGGSMPAVKVGRAPACAYLDGLGLTMGNDFATFACTAMQSPDGAEGVLLVAQRASQELTPEKQRILENIGRQLGLAIRNTRLVQERSDLLAQRELDRLRAAFISSVSHELRSPLGVIKGYVTTLQRQDVPWDDVTRQEFLNVISEESDMLLELIENLLDISRVQQGRLLVSRQEVALGPLLVNVASKMATIYPSHRIGWKLTESLPTLPIDPRRIEQVLRNLVGNAVKYSPKGSQILIKGDVVDQGAKVSVMDEGMGISEEDRERIFEAFYRSDSPITRGVGGAGLGLTICKELVEAHGGRIWVEAGLDGGAAFSFILPLKEEADGDEIWAEEGVEREKGASL